VHAAQCARQRFDRRADGLVVVVARAQRCARCEVEHGEVEGHDGTAEIDGSHPDSRHASSLQHSGHDALDRQPVIRRLRQPGGLQHDLPAVGGLGGEHLVKRAGAERTDLGGREPG
jgi:hypothetical protein